MTQIRDDIYDVQTLNSRRLTSIIIKIASVRNTETLREFLYTNLFVWIDDRWHTLWWKGHSRRKCTHFMIRRLLTSQRTLADNTHTAMSLLYKKCVLRYSVWYSYSVYIDRVCHFLIKMTEWPKQSCRCRFTALRLGPREIDATWWDDNTKYLYI